jgi:hypothetical protein
MEQERANGHASACNCDGSQFMGFYMKKMMTALASVTLVMGVTACNKASDDVTTETATASGIAGTWKANVDSAKYENDTTSFVLTNGTFTCNSCLPPFSVAADGIWQKVDRPGYDAQKVEVVNDRTVKSSRRLGDKEISVATFTVSEDGKTLTNNWTNLEGEVPTEGSTIFTRTKAGPDGSLAMSGDWAVSDFGTISDAALISANSLDGDKYTSRGNGGGFTAVLGGEPVTIDGDNSRTLVAVAATGDNSYRETYTRDGKVVSVVDLVVAGDTLNGTATDPRDNSVFRWTATRQ